jgi:hypothetical protein
VFAEDAFLSIVDVEDDAPMFIELSRMFKPSCVSCRIASNDSATCETSISLAEIASDAMVLSAGIAIIFSSLDMLKITEQKKKINLCASDIYNLPFPEQIYCFANLKFVS